MTVNHDVTGSSPVGGATSGQEESCPDFLFVTDNLDGDFVSGVIRSATVYGGTGTTSSEVYYFNPGEKIKEPSIREINDSLASRCKEALLEQNVELTETTAELSGQRIS